MKIDLLDIFSRIIAIRKKLYKAAIIGLLIGIIVWASIPKKIYGHCNAFSRDE